MALRQKNKFLEFVYDFYSSMKNHEISLAYEGEMNHQVMKAFTNLTIEKMSRQSENNPIQKKVFHVMVECLQNISKHAFHSELNSENDLNNGVLLVSNTEEFYQVTTGNIIEKNKVKDLNEFLEMINELDDSNLRNLYKKQLKEGAISLKGGAGVGFIDIKRKTGRKLEFHFLPLNNSQSFFIFTSTIPRKLKP
ncbi:MAG: SiaB family protein kinase [Bacteroidales bacterium]|nr:SiaB family protein kinase [Bacteroidales bacterium]MCF8391482.1 SiaB family protein kinase [Bacteroidales bacterium]